MTTTPTKSNSALATRVVTALVLAVVVVGVLVTGNSLAWSILMLLFCIAAVWEGGRLTAPAQRFNYFVPVFALTWLAWLAYALFRSDTLGRWLDVSLVLSTLFWLCCAPIHLRQKAIARNSPALSGIYLAGLIAAAWVSAVLLQRMGTGYLIAVVVTTVIADVAGYFFGRSFGKVKLAPSISPGKTREGAWGGIVCAGLWTALAASYLGLIEGPLSHVAAGIVGMLLGAVAIMGDLWESLLKRQAGVKDSSNLLPGHGGVLDRIDAQLAVLPIATLLILLVKPA